MAFHRFLELPAEVRQIVLEDLLVPYTRASSSPNTVCIDTNSGFQAKQYHSVLETVDQTDNDFQVYPQIIRTSQQMFNGGIKCLYSKNHFQIKQNTRSHGNATTTMKDIGRMLLLINCSTLVFLPSFFTSIGVNNVSLIKGLTCCSDGTYRHYSIHHPTNLLLEKLLTTYPALVNLETLILEVPSPITNHVYEHQEHINQLNVDEEDLNDGSERAIERWAARQDEWALKLCVLRVVNVLHQHGPDLANIYEGVRDEARFVMFRRTL